MNSMITAAAALLVLSVAAQAETTQRYLVSFSDPAILELDPNVLKAGDGTVKVGARAKAMFGVALSKQSKHLQLAEAKFQLKLQPVMRVLYTNNLVALDLTEAEAAQLRSLSEVASVEPEFVHTLQTDVGPSFVGATDLWQSTTGQTGARGAGVLVGVVDSGIAASHPSFAGQSSDGYLFPATFARLGLCTSAAATRCNNKLVGIYDFTTEEQ